MFPSEQVADDNTRFVRKREFRRPLGEQRIKTVAKNKRAKHTSPQTMPRDLLAAIFSTSSHFSWAKPSSWLPAWKLLTWKLLTSLFWPRPSCR